LDIWTSAAAMPNDVWGAATSAANGMLLVQGGAIGAGNNVITNQGYTYDPTSDSWSALPNAGNAAFRFAGALGFYTVGGGQGPFGGPLSTVAVLPGYDQPNNPGLPWLTESATSVTLAPGASTTVTLTFNAADPSITQPGEYTGFLSAETDTPYVLSQIPVTMTVSAPRTWGKITGVVQFTDAHGSLVPIADATVQIDTWAGHYTLHTDRAGGYALWLDVRNNPLTVIAAKDGFQPQVVTVRIEKGTTITRTFTVLKD
jgi:hypothetical protein